MLFNHDCCDYYWKFSMSITIHITYIFRLSATRLVCFCNYAPSWMFLYMDLVFEYCINTLRPRQNERHFADDMFKCIFLNENAWIPMEISLKFVPKGPINKIPALFQIMAWRRPGDKPLSETMLVSLLAHKCVTRPQWVKHVTFGLMTRCHG